MDLKILLDTPPWEWPGNAAESFHEVLIDRRAKKSDRLIAAELAGDITVINEALADCLLEIVRNPEEPDPLRATAATSLGPVLEQTEIDGFGDDPDGFEVDPEDRCISEPTFRKIQSKLQQIYFDESTPKLVRRRVLEASVRASADWHQDAIRAAYLSGDRDWVLTAVFAMRWVQGFDDEILEALTSTDPDIHYEAVEAAGNRGVKAAWPHIAALLRNARTRKPLLFAAIGAVANIRPEEASILMELADSDDEEIAEAAEEAIMMANAALTMEEDEEPGSEWVN
jgi:hypothetical protein